FTLLLWKSSPTSTSSMTSPPCARTVRPRAGSPKRPAPRVSDLSTGDRASGQPDDEYAQPDEHRLPRQGDGQQEAAGGAAYVQHTRPAPLRARLREGRRVGDRVIDQH